MSVCIYECMSESHRWQHWAHCTMGEVTRCQVQPTPAQAKLEHWILLLLLSCSCVCCLLSLVNCVKNTWTWVTLLYGHGFLPFHHYCYFNCDNKYVHIMKKSTEPAKSISIRDIHQYTMSLKSIKLVFFK